MTTISVMCASTKYIDGISANCQNIGAITSTLNEKIISTVSINY